ncbi:hypothetical protein GS452_07250 [Rhodococcus hoagii]|nr:hypothetical protein [Prescottella equi]
MVRNQTALSAAWGFIQPIFEAIGAVFTWLYENIVQPIFTALRSLWPLSSPRSYCGGSGSAS